MSHLTGRQILLLLAGAFALASLAVGVYGLVRGPGGASRPTDTAPGAAPGTALRETVAPGRPTTPALAPQDRQLPHTGDPIAYAEAVAATLFEWDTRTGFLPVDYTAAVAADADPSGEETPGLLADVATYVPTLEQWLDLGAMDVEQSLAIEEAYVPSSWEVADQQAHGQLRPGTTAVTITGIRHRSGTWGGAAAESSSPVSFTVFVACAPSFPRCHVLRLSELDNPLR
ncbi:hypothetical protein GCM10009795_004830 [Nocardioides hankookensis]|uniref:Uncharacterized protein n=1 Tax=Nocardioides hankookensis TaxID=443157 RepID=A0ABW1LLE9_9ACTN